MFNNSPTIFFFLSSVNKDEFLKETGDGYCALLLACRLGNQEVVEALLKRGAPPTSVVEVRSPIDVGGG